tara:strand:+ start:2739 stop:3353 length:615 start_codon:yes stop_codon:yes gene_type:complete
MAKDKKRSPSPKESKASKSSDKARAKKTKSKKTKVVTFNSVEPEIMHEPCGEGQAPVVTVTKVKKVKKPKAKEPKKTSPASVETFAGGLRVGWKVHMCDHVIPFHSVRDMFIGLKEADIPVKNVEQVRAFIRRRKQGVAAKKKSYDHFEGVDHIYKAGSDIDLLAGRQVESSHDEATDSSSSSSSSSEDEEETTHDSGSACTVV